MREMIELTLKIDGTGAFVQGPDIWRQLKPGDRLDITPAPAVWYAGSYARVGDGPHMWRNNSDIRLAVGLLDGMRVMVEVEV